MHLYSSRFVKTDQLLFTDSMKMQFLSFSFLSPDPASIQFKVRQTGAVRCISVKATCDNFIRSDYH